MTKQAPDLQKWIEAAGAYHLIDWAAWDEAVGKYQRERRELLLQEQGNQTPRQADRRRAGGGS